MIQKPWIQKKSELRVLVVFFIQKFKENYNRLSEEYEMLKQKIESTEIKFQEKRAKITYVQKFLNEIPDKSELITEFDENLFISMVDKIIVKSYI